MLIPNQRRIYTTDFSEENQELIAKLSESLNINLEVLYRALNKNITLGENIACTVKDIDLTATANGTPTSSIAIERSNTLPILGITVLNARNLDNSAGYPTGTPFISYELNGEGKVIINNITNLIANNKYRLKIVIWN